MSELPRPAQSSSDEKSDQARERELGAERPGRERAKRSGPAAIALVIGLAALTAQAGELDVVRDIQRYCAVCWRNARLDPCLWEDCTQEVCLRLLTKAKAGELELAQVLEDDTAERRELVRAIDMVRKRVQRARRPVHLESFDLVAGRRDEQVEQRRELGEILELARRAVLTERQDRIFDLWLDGWTVPEIAEELGMSAARVSDEKYKGLRKLERHLAERGEAVPRRLDDEERRESA
jgi:RNA polymerase sigma factor (sigma-70 family)